MADIEKYIDAITNIDLFRDFTRHQLLNMFMGNKYIIRRYIKGEIIHLQNEACRTMDLVLSGQVSVQKIDENGNVLTISSFSSSDIIGVNLLFANKNNYPMTIISKVNSIILHINKDLILELCQNNKNFLIGLITVISNKTLTLTDKINSITLKTIRQCIIDFLIYEHSVQKSNVIKLNISKKEIAERLGIQRPSLSRELNKMRRDGLIQYDANSITISNIAMLKK